MSQLSEIYTALAAKVVTVGATNVAAKDVSELPQSVETGVMPIRLLLPFNEKAGGDELSIVTFGRTATIDWRITDLLFWASAGQGSGLANAAPSLVAYKAAYVDMIRQMRWPQGVGDVVGLELRPGDFEWPRGSQRWYYGVAATVTVREFL